MEVGVILAAIGRGFVAGAAMLWNLIKQPPGSYIALALAAALALWWFGQHEFDRGQAECEAAHARASVAIERGAAELGTVTLADFTLDATKILGDFRGQLDATFYITKIQLKEVQVHVTAETDNRYPLPCGLVRMHDAAILGADPAELAGAGCERDEQPAPVKASDLSAALVRDGDYTRRLEAQRDALKALVTLYRDTWEGYRAGLIKVNDQAATAAKED